MILHIVSCCVKSNVLVLVCARQSFPDAEVAVGRVQAGAVEFAAAGLLYFLEPVIERVRADAAEGDGAAILDASQKINAKSFCRPFHSGRRRARAAIIS